MRTTRRDSFAAASIIPPLLCLIIILGHLQSHAQFQDDFSDGDFISDPSWTGDTSLFTVTYSSAVPDLKKPALKLNGLGEDTSILVVASTLAMQAEWRFWIKFSFNSSANNYARVYLISDQPDLTNPLNGYFVQVGGSNDSIGLYRQTGVEFFHLISGGFAYTGNSTNILHIKVTRDGSGHWQLYADPQGGYDFVLEGSVEDTIVQSSLFFGISCRYTSSNATKFYFDDFYAADLYADTIPPYVQELSLESPETLRIIFSEEVEPASAQDSLNYQVNGGAGHPVAAVVDPDDHSSVDLSFDDEFTAGLSFTLHVSNVRDLSGNIMLPGAYPFNVVLQPPLKPGQLLIHEVMADVSPAPSGLPEAEYVELYNPGPQEVNLKGSTLQPRESSLPLLLPGVMLPADSYLLVARPADTLMFQGYGPVIGLGGFGVNNEGTIILRNADGEVVHAVTYSTGTYKDLQKEKGGWSLELIDPGNPCAGEKSWGASSDPAGGTPGSVNSVSETIASVPQVESLFLVHPHLLQIRFSHQMDSVSLADPLKYNVPGSGNPVSAAVAGPFFDLLELTFDTPFQDNGIFKLVLTDSIGDFCGGYLNPGMEYTFVQPGDSGPWEIVINEVMADWDPPAGLPGHEYIELFNVTDRFLRIQGWSLAVDDDSFEVPTLIATPGEYLLLVGEEEALILDLFARTFVIEGMTLPNSGGTIALTDATGTLVSGCRYDQSLYGDPGLASGGYSLELTDPYNPCGEQGNWLATEAPAGGTPGALNSVDADYGEVVSISSALIENGTALHVVFDMKLDKGQLIDPALFSVDHGMGSPWEVLETDLLGSAFRLLFEKDFYPGILYSLTVTQPLVNCVGLTYPETGEIVFGVPEVPEPSDAVINEVLFNPAGDGVDFVEIVNRSGKILNLRDMKLGTIRTDIFGAADTLLYDLVYTDRLFLMGAFVVLTKNPERIRDQYFCGVRSDFCRMASFPALNNDKGNVMLVHGSGQVIDKMEYDAEMHHPLLSTVEGVSLERLHPDRSSGDPTNWHSAASARGFATPALQNSQFSETSVKAFDLWVDPAIFSPDNDGFEDVVTIGYRFDSPGFMASVLIFDAEGRPVRSLVNNVMLGTTGYFTWDGISDDRQKAGIGIYVIYFEAFDPGGRVEHNLTTVVLAGRLN